MTLHPDWVRLAQRMYSGPGPVAFPLVADAGTGTASNQEPATCRELEWFGRDSRANPRAPYARVSLELTWLGTPFFIVGR